MKRFVLCTTFFILELVTTGNVHAQCECNNSEGVNSNNIGGYLPEELQHPIYNNSFINNGITKAQVEALCARFHNYFPDVTFVYREDRDQVNAVAFGDGVTFPRTVEMWGGMAKHPVMGLEGLAVILGHEVGHHYGNTDKVITNPTRDSLQKRYPHGAFCEDQSDFWSTRIGLRIVYNNLGEFTNANHNAGDYNFATVDNNDSDEYAAKVQLGIDQCYRLLSGGVFAASSDYLKASSDVRANFASSGCGHPQAGCRKAIYESGKRKSLRAACNDALEFFSNARQESNEEFIFRKYEGKVRLMHYGHRSTDTRTPDPANFSADSAGPSNSDLIKAINSLKEEIESLKAKIKE
jgi:hypothetical protein